MSVVMYSAGAAGRLVLVRQQQLDLLLDQVFGVLAELGGALVAEADLVAAAAVARFLDLEDDAVLDGDVFLVAHRQLARVFLVDQVAGLVLAAGIIDLDPALAVVRAS